MHFKFAKNFSNFKVSIRHFRKIKIKIHEDQANNFKTKNIHIRFIKYKI